MKVTLHLAKPRKMKFPILSWLIRWAEGTPYSHAGVEFHGKLLGIVFDSVAPRSRVITSMRWHDHYEPVISFDFELRPEQVQPAFEWAFSNTDKAYSKWQITMIGLSHLFRGFGRKVAGKTFNGESRLTCVEAAATFAHMFLGAKFPKSLDMLGLKDFEKVIEEAAK